MIYDANGQQYTTEAATVDKQFEEIPPYNFAAPTNKPHWFDAELAKIGGYVDRGSNSIPRYRVVWGMDPNVQHFAMGKMRIKYPTIIDHIETIVGYDLVDVTGEKPKQHIKAEEAIQRFMNPASGQLTENIEDGLLLVPVILQEEREIGSPWWIVEQYVPAEAFGTRQQWEDNRYLVNPVDSREYIDVLGEYPKRGAYIHWLDILDVDDEGRQVYKALDESVIEIVRANHVMNIARRKEMDKTKAQRQLERDAVRTEIWESQKPQIAREMLDVKKNRKFNITPKG